VVVVQARAPNLNVVAGLESSAHAI
jgi:hypothetical protein